MNGETMENTVPISWVSDRGEIMEDEAIIEYVVLREEGEYYREIVNIFLPEGIPYYQREEVKRNAAETFNYTAWY